MDTMDGTRIKRVVEPTLVSAALRAVLLFRRLQSHIRNHLLESRTLNCMMKSLIKSLTLQRTWQMKQSKRCNKCWRQESASWYTTKTSLRQWKTKQQIEQRTLLAGECKMPEASIIFVTTMDEKYANTRNVCPDKKREGWYWGHHSGWRA